MLPTNYIFSPSNITIYCVLLVIVVLHDFFFSLDAGLNYKDISIDVINFVFH